MDQKRPGMRKWRYRNHWSVKIVGDSTQCSRAQLATFISLERPVLYNKATQARRHQLKEPHSEVSHGLSWDTRALLISDG